MDDLIIPRIFTGSFQRNDIFGYFFFEYRWSSCNYAENYFTIFMYCNISKSVRGFLIINLFYICGFAWSLYVSNSDQIMTLGIKCHLKFTAVLTKFCPTLKSRPENDTAT